MIPQSGIMKIAAIAFAGGAHLALVAFLAAPVPAQIEGGGGATDVQLGVSFQDLVQGAALTPRQPATVATPGSAVPLATRADAAFARPAEAEALSPTRTAAAAPIPAAPTVDAASVPLAKPIPLASQALAENLVSGRRLTVPSAVNAMAVTATDSSQAAVALDAIAPDRLPAKVPDDVITGMDRSAQAPMQSLRPEPRPARAPAQAEPARTPDRRPAPTTSGNANRSATTGTPDAQNTGNSASSGTSSARQATGNAAASNYPGEVMRCISRAARLNRNSGGAAVVTFSVSGNGRIAGVGLAASSGDARHDRAATNAISRAGPCPPPPRGAQTRFSVRIE